MKSNLSYSIVLRGWAIGQYSWDDEGLLVGEPKNSADGIQQQQKKKNLKNLHLLADKYFIIIW